MSLTDEERRAIVEYRIEKARVAVEDVEQVSGLKRWSAAANRMYYALYYAATALLIANGYVCRTHTGMITLLHKHFVLKGVLTKAEGRLVGKVFDIRQEADYDDFIDADENLIQEYFPQVKALVEKMISLIEF
jgi:uncharacterized protein (UPF0332 family)